MIKLDHIICVMWFVLVVGGQMQAGNIMDSAEAKELVRLEALGLLDFYEELYKDDPSRPNRELAKGKQKMSKSSS